MIEPMITPKLVVEHNLPLDGLALIRLVKHPKRAGEPLLGSHDGKWIFESIFAALRNKTVAQAV